MSELIGKTISQYRIIEELGRGGMGIVYKAEDTKLDRLVALKFLPHNVQANAEEKARFLQEAKAAATLNQPNICTIHDIKEEDGNNFIVMEFVDGMTLREKFRQAPISVKDAAEYAIQIGEALEEAHTRSIVHRDIKSDNIMVNKKNQIKVMDFGLAKLKGSLKLTKAASTIGTLGYMAPEQIQGGEADARSDIFSFGVVLFEMLTARLPFRGEHEAAMMYSILNEEPEPLQKFIPDAPPELVHILTTALEKDPNERYQTAAEMTRELRRLLKQSSRVSRAHLSSSTIPLGVKATPAPEVHSNKMLWLSIVAGIVVVAAVVAYVMTRPSSRDESVTITTLNPNMTFRVLPIQFTQFSYPGFSRDGNWIAFPAADGNNKWDIYYMHVSGSNTRRLTADSIVVGNNLSADISPDGSQVAYSALNDEGQSTINIVSSVGGLSKRIADGNAILPRWRPDGQRIGYVNFQPRNSRVPYPLWSMKPDGGDNRLEYGDTLGVGGRFSFNWSPDGKSVAWIRSFKEGYQELFTRELETGKEVQLTSDKKNLDDVAWTSNGFIIFSSNRGGNSNLWMVPVKGGTPQQLTKGSGPDIGVSISADNQKLVYLQQQPIGHVWVADLATSSARQLTFDDRVVRAISLSPDGKKLALALGEIDPLKPAFNLYLQDRDGSNRRQVTFDELTVQNPAWSPDGKWISFAMVPRYYQQDSAKLYLLDATNPGSPKYIAPGTRSFWLDAKTLVARNVRTTEQTTTTFDELVNIENGSRERFLWDSTVATGLISGNMFVYFDNREKTKGVWMLPADYVKNPSQYRPKKLLTPPGAMARSMNFAYYVNSQNELSRIDNLAGKQERFKSSFPGLDGNSLASVSKEDKEIFYVTFQLSGKLVMMENIFK